MQYDSVTMIAAILGAFFVLVALKFRKVQNGRVAGCFIAHAPQFFHEGFNINAVTRRNKVYVAAIGLGAGLELFQPLGRDKVDLVDHLNLLALTQLFVKAAQFLVDEVKARPGVFVAHVFYAQDMHQKARALYMLEKTQTKALAFVCAFDQTGNIGNDHATVGVNLVDHNTEVGRKRGKGVGRNLGPRRRNLGDKGRLARIGQAQQTGIGQNLQLKAQVLFLTRFTGLAKTGGTHGRRLEMLVALAAASTTGHQHFCIGVAEVGQQLLAIGAFGKNQRAHRQVQHHVFTLLAIALAALAGAAITGLVQALEAKIVQ